MENSDQPLTSPEHVPVRRLGSLDLACLGWNSVIGSGLFLTQGDIAKAIGPYGPLMFLAGGLLSLPIGLCFGQLARAFGGTGGASLYAHKVFGPRPGFVVGWVMWMSGLIGGATVSHGLAKYFIELRSWPAGWEAPLAAFLVLVLAGINLLGTRGGAWSNNVLAGLKLGPLLCACLVAPWLFGPDRLIWPSLPLPVEPDWLLGLLLVLYTYSGFEEIALPAGETRDSERVVPRSIVLVILSSALAYTVLQGAVSADSATALAQRPLESTFSPWSPWLGQALVLAGLVSFAGVNASIAFTTPRSLWTLAHHGWFPRALERIHEPSGAPRLAIVVSATLTVGLIFLQNLEALVALSVLASLLQHLSSSMACWKLRGWTSMPGLPHLSVAVCLLLLQTSKLSYLTGMGLSILLGMALSAVLPARAPHSQAMNQS